MYQYLHSYMQNQITIQVQVWKTLVVSAFLGVSGHWNIEHCNIFWSVNFTLVYFGLTFHSTNVKNFPKIFAFQSFDYAGHGPVVRRINDSIEGPLVRRFIDLKDMSHSTSRHWHDKTKSFLFDSFESADKILSLTSYITLMRQNIVDRIEFF